ncbi:MAG: heat-shock protein [Rhodospirillales bacterium]|nr:heat-shock protein [Rhodospirillales bacterium]MDB5380880.1 heat-shock protein [Rhodospirillales bacterium]
MNAIDFSPLFRSAIGFDRLTSLMESARGTADNTTYPPYNIERTGQDGYVLTMAVAGFGPDDITITAVENTLSIAGRAQEQSEPGSRFLHRGIAARAFERRFVLADHIVIEGASLVNGLLHVTLKRQVPEALKPRRIAIQGASPQVQAPQAEAPASGDQAQLAA